MNPRVSVLLTTWNRPGMLAEAVESVLAQTYEDFELIVLDDNSDDPAQIAFLASLWNHPQVIIYKSGVQPGERAARVRYAVLANTGLSLARGEYITYLCDDDLYLPGRLAAMTARLDQGGCQVVYGSQRCERDGVVQYVRPAIFALDVASCIVDHSSVMHTRQAAVDAGGWDDHPGHWMQADAAFWDRLTRAGHLFFPVQEITDVHRFHAGSVSEAGVPA
jgi:spore maturation protein CgeD